MTAPTIYDDAAIEAYDLIATMLSPASGMVSWVEQHARLSEASVLDLGAGTGTSSRALSEAGAKVTAVDASQASLQYLRAQSDDHDIRAVQGDFRALELDEQFDVITLSRNTFFLAQSQDDKVALLSTMARHLRPGGRAFLDCTDPKEFLRHGGDATSVTYPLGRDKVVTITQTADASTQMVLSIFIVQGASSHVAFHESATWATLAEIRLMAATAGLEVEVVDGSYRGDLYDSRSREMLVVLATASTSVSGLTKPG